MIDISIIIPTYRRPLVVARCLELISQSRNLGKKFQAEVIIVDSSPDQSTWEEIKTFQKYFKINYLHLVKQTLPGEARNIGVKNARFELIFSIDSDIEVRKNTLWQMIEYLKEHPTVGRMTGKSIFSSGSQKDQTDRPTQWDRIFKKDGTIYIEGIYGRYEAFYKSAFQKIGGYDPIFERCGEGTDLSIRFWRAGFPLGYSQDIIAGHNSEAPGSLRRSDSERMVAMYRSLFLIAYKYDVESEKISPNFIRSHEERQNAYGQTTEFYSIVAAAKSIEWFQKNNLRLIKSKKEIPILFDFKPFDVFTDKKNLEKCLEGASQKNNSSYRQVFRN